MADRFLDGIDSQDNQIMRLKALCFENWELGVKFSL